MVDASRDREEDSPMAKRAKSKARVAKAKKARAGKHRQAVQALDAAGVPHQEIGKLNPDGTPQIDFKSLEKFKKTLGKAAFANVRFRALNAPFKRRAAIPSG
jgi:hypothetical protein